ncbi:MAG: dipeptide epimerase [Rhizobiales bacterium]|nr:dipeptide epimerase [Hyphomicrobiales bacterium]
MAPALTVAVERWPIAGRFVISRGARTEATVVVATITEGVLRGRGECVPYPRYGETVDGVVAAIEAMGAAIAAGMDREALCAAMPAGAARNAIDCALWDLEAKRSGISVAAQLGLDPKPLVTAYTLSLGTPAEMEAAAAKASDRLLLKVKLGGEGDAERIAAVRRGAPQARLVVDANEAWTEATFDSAMRACVAAGVELIEQPLPAGHDQLLATVDRPIAICADESLHVATDLADLAGRYDAVNVKLDKAGGLTEALLLVKAAKQAGMGVMVGCMVGTSLAMAPAVLLAQDADFVDLDGPLLLARDRDDALAYPGSLVSPPTPALWG